MKAPGELLQRSGFLPKFLPCVVLVTVVLWALWPLAVHSWDHVVDTRALYPALWRTIEPDIWLQIWILAWGAHILPIDPLSLYHANAFYPTPNVIARSDHLLGMLPLYAPAWYLTGNPVFAFQFTMLASYLLCGLFFYALLRHVGCSRAVGVGIAILWTLMAFRVNDGLARAQLLQYQYLPLIVLFFDRYLERGRARDLAWASLFLMWQSLTAYWHAYFAVYTATVTISASAVFSEVRSNLRRIGWSLAALAGVGALLTAISLPYLDMSGEGQLIPKSLPASLSAYFGGTSFPAYISGVAAAAIAMLAFRGTARQRRVGLCFLLIAAGGILLSLPADPASASVLDRLLGLPRRLAIEIVPGFRYLRDEYRFLTLASLGIYGLAAIGVDGGYRALKARSPVVAVVALVMFFGMAGARLADLQIPLTQVSAMTVAPPVYEWLRENGEGGTVLELPISKTLVDANLEAEYMFYSTYHWLPLVNGYTGHPPRAHYARVRSLVARLPDPAALEELTTLTGLRWIVIHDALHEYFGMRGWGQSPRLKQVGEFGSAYLVEVVP